MRPYLRQVAGQWALGSLAGIAMNTAVVLPAILLGRALDTALALADGRATPAALGWAALAYAAGVAATEGPRVLKRWWLGTANARIRTNVRADCLRGILAWPMARLHTQPVGDVMARVIGDVEVLGKGVSELTIEMWDTALFSLSLVTALLLYDAGLTLLALLPVPAAMVLAHAAGRWVGERTTAAREANSALTVSLQEHLAGLRVLRLFGRTRAAVDRVAALSARLADAQLALTRLQGGLRPVYSTLMTAGVVVIVWGGGERVIDGAMTVGTFVAYLELYLRFVNRGFRVPQLFNSIQSAAAAYARLRPLLAPAAPLQDEPPLASFRASHVAGTGMQARARPMSPAAAACAASPGGTAVLAPSGPIAVSLERVRFRYPGAAAPALRGVSLAIRAGAFVAVTGPVAAGKSALARALLGLYPLEAGRVLLDGRPLEALPSALRAARVGYLPQDAYLLSGTVRENVQLAFAAGTAPAPAPATGAASAERSSPSACPVGAAVALAALDEDVRALAAAAPYRPGLLVLDDPFSAVDVDTEARIVTALRAAVGPSAPPAHRATVVLCSHRLLAFPQADHVVVLDRGRIVEQGTHAALLQAGGLYARIYRAQHAALHHARPTTQPVEVRG